MCSGESHLAGEPREPQGEAGSPRRERDGNLRAEGWGAGKEPGGAPTPHLQLMMEAPGPEAGLHSRSQMGEGPLGRGACQAGPSAPVCRSPRPPGTGDRGRGAQPTGAWGKPGSSRCSEDSRRAVGEDRRRLAISEPPHTAESKPAEQVPADSAGYRTRRAGLPSPRSVTERSRRWAGWHAARAQAQLFSACEPPFPQLPNRKGRKGQWQDHSASWRLLRCGQFRASGPLGWAGLCQGSVALALTATPSPTQTPT